MKSITQCSEVQGKYVIVRSSCNVPITDGVVTNIYRLKQALPTLVWLKEAGARVIVIAHIGRAATDTLRPVCEAFNKLIPMTWGGNITGADFSSVRNDMKDGDIVMVENLRQDEREGANSVDFATMLASFGDIYVNDAFDNIHRDHASMVTLPTLLPAYAGITLKDEVDNVTKAMNPTSPSLFILGGAKFETKLPLIEKYLVSYDQVFVGGALLNDILKADGYSVGTSLVSDISLAGAAFLNSSKLIRPIDIVVRSERGDRTVLVHEVAEDEMIIDVGPATVALLAPYIAAAKTILWNGPLGLYESGAPGATHAVATLVAAAEGYSVIGGGDTVAAIEDLGLNTQFGFVSTGGGAMLTLLENGTTKALQALN